jgi:hypothetical protein
MHFYQDRVIWLKKTHVRAHRRRTRSGRTVGVREHERRLRGDRRGVEGEVLKKFVLSPAGSSAWSLPETAYLKEDAAGGYYIVTYYARDSDVPEDYVFQDEKTAEEFIQHLRDKDIAGEDLMDWVYEHGGWIR